MKGFRRETQAARVSISFTPPTDTSSVAPVGYNANRVPNTFDACQKTAGICRSCFCLFRVLALERAPLLTASALSGKLTDLPPRQRRSCLLFGVSQGILTDLFARLGVTRALCRAVTRLLKEYKSPRKRTMCRSLSCAVGSSRIGSLSAAIRLLRGRSLAAAF